MPAAAQQQHDDEMGELGVSLSDILSLDGDPSKPRAATAASGTSSSPHPSNRVRLFELECVGDMGDMGDISAETLPAFSTAGALPFDDICAGNASSPCLGQMLELDLGSREQHQHQHQQQQRNAEERRAKRHTVSFHPEATQNNQHQHQPQKPQHQKRAAGGGKRPASWGGHSNHWRGSHGGDKTVAIITCAGCNVQLPANQAVGHASQCNRLQGGAGKRAAGASSPDLSPRGSRGSNGSSGRSRNGSARDSFTSAYSLFIAKELEGAKGQRGEVPSGKWKAMSPAEKFQDIATRNKALKESLLQRMTAATAKWEGMSAEAKKPFFEEAERNRTGGDQQQPQQQQQPQPLQCPQPSERQAKRVSWSPELDNDTSHRRKMHTRGSASPASPASPISPSVDVTAGSLAQLQLHQLQQDTCGQLAQLALYLTATRLSQSTPSLPVAGASLLQMQGGGFASTSYPTLPTASWEVASATDSESSDATPPPSPTYGATTAKVVFQGPEGLRALLDSDSDDDDDDDASTDAGEIPTITAVHSMGHQEVLA